MPKMPFACRERKSRLSANPLGTPGEGGSKSRTHIPWAVSLPCWGCQLCFPWGEQEAGKDDSVTPHPPGMGKKRNSNQAPGDRDAAAPAKAPKPRADSPGGRDAETPRAPLAGDAVPIWIQHAVTQQAESKQAGPKKALPAARERAQRLRRLPWPPRPSVVGKLGAEAGKQKQDQRSHPW